MTAAKTTRTVLIVDDEIRINKLIEKLIKWESLGLSFAGSADNGATALSFIKQFNPDIVITDIRMPIINGLELIRLTKEFNPNTRIIVISGYKEFEYAHKALQYGVNDYLLKPINEDELNSVLHKIVEAFQVADQRTADQKKANRIINQSEQILKSNFLNNLIDNSKNINSMIASETYNIALDAPCYTSFVVKLDCLNINSINENLEQVVTGKITNIIQNNLKEVVTEAIVTTKKFMFIYCIVNYFDTEKKLFKSSLRKILLETQEYLSNLECYMVTIGLSNERGDIGEIRFAISEAYQAVQNRIKLGVEKIISINHLNCTDINPAEDYLAPHFKTLLTSIENYSDINFEQAINDIYSIFMTNVNLDYSACYEIADNIVDFFTGHQNFNKAEFSKQVALIKTQCMHAYSISALKNILKSRLGAWLKAGLQSVEFLNGRPVRTAKEYIQTHYNKKITLEDIADIVDLNPVYFSTLFKKETGSNFSTYLLNIRIAKAKSLLKEGNDTIAAVAEKVGYKDARFFSQTFTKEVGVKPVVFRKLHS